MLYPILPVFLTETLGATGSVVGIVEGTATAVQYIWQGVAGWLSDRFQRPKRIALVGYVVAAGPGYACARSVCHRHAVGASRRDDCRISRSRTQRQSVRP